MKLRSPIVRSTPTNQPATAPPLDTPPVGGLQMGAGADQLSQLDQVNEYEELYAAATGAAAPSAPNPRKPVTGTSYSSQGMPGIPPPQVDVEYGSGLPNRVIELVPDLLPGYIRTVTYTRMMNDAGVDVSMRVSKTPVLGAEYFIEPVSEDPNDLIVAEFVASNLLDGLSAPFINSLEDILHFYEDGYSVLEKVYENREWSPSSKGSNAKVYTMLKKLGIRPASTLKDITYDDNGGPVEITQTAIRGDGSTSDAVMPISKVLVFTFNRNGGDLTGKSLLRTAYPHWYYKTHFYKIDAIQKERHSLGVPKGKLLAGYNEADHKLMRQMLRMLRTNEESFVLLTPNVDLEFAQVHGNLVNVLESATHHNMMIMLNVMAQFMVLGVSGGGGGGSGGGGRATAGSQVDIFMKALRFIANMIADCINIYLIPELVVYNFPTRKFPKLRVRNIGETRDLQMLGAAIANLYSQQAVTGDDSTENWIRKVFDMPAKQPGATSSSANQNGNQPVSQPQSRPANQPANNNGKGGVGQPGPGNTGKPENAPQ